jgi:hypothetical protein
LKYPRLPNTFNYSSADNSKLHLSPLENSIQFQNKIESLEASSVGTPSKQMSTQSATDYKRFLHLLPSNKVAAPAAPAPVVTLPSANPFALTPEEEDSIMREVDEEYDEQLDRRILAEGVDTPPYSSPFDQEDALARQEERDLFSGNLDMYTYHVSCWEEMDTNPCGDTRCQR